MLHKTSDATVKYTAILPQGCVDELRLMADKKIISSVNQGIRSAVEDFVTSHKLREYQQQMQKAAADKAFIQRTMDTQQAFEVVDAEVDGQW